ncbi:restriction endonuclease subunit S [uncultured Methylophaga sp.]|uniref:restriction endonuclease subunit S n=1 Tax=uncultured Methylophaga sp. TaxID=285271 RepID=UPI002623AFEE|nr:restriction endonuclease subunit S [uncultured Methylophaga sp.]
MNSVLTANQFKKVALGDCCEIISGSTPSRNKAEFWDGEINWFTPKDLSRIKSKYISEAPEKITALGLKSCSTTLLPKNSLLLSSRAPIGHIAITTIEACTNQGFKSLMPNKNLDVEYLYFAIKNIIPQLKDLGNGATFKEISKSTLSKVQIPIPPLAEQKQIATILDAADSLRLKDQQLVEHYTALSQSLFLEMFGDPISNPRGWDVSCLGNIGKWHSGGTPNRKNTDYFAGDIPWVTSGELNNMYISDSKEHISEDAIKNSAAKIINKDSLLLGMYDTAALKSSITTEVISCNQAIAFSTLDSSKANTVFVYSMIQYGKEHFRRLQRGVRQKNLNLTMIKEIEIIHPPIELQNQFAERIKIIEQQKQQAKTNLQKSEALFNSLLQQAFTGELTADRAA